jgi:hypothetical protein
MQNTGKRCVILLVFIILRWSFNYESNVFRYNKILIDCVFGNGKFVVPSTLTVDLGFASFNSQCLGDNKLAIPSYPVNKYIIQTAQGSWYRLMEMILSEPKAREISVSRSVLGPKGSLYILILPFISVTIVFIALKTRIWHTQCKCTVIFQGIMKPTNCPTSQ